MNIDDYLSLNHRALQELTPAEQFRVLGDLAERASAWVTDQRGVYIERMRAELGLSDEELAARLGVGRTALARLGDGPMTGDGVRPALLRRGAELLLEHTDRHVSDLMRALGLLTKKGRPVLGDQQAAARRITLAAGSLSGVDMASMSSAERAIVSRAVSHAGEVAEGVQRRPSRENTTEN